MALELFWPPQMLHPFPRFNARLLSKDDDYIPPICTLNISTMLQLLHNMKTYYSITDLLLLRLNQHAFNQSINDLEDLQMGFVDDDQAMLLVACVGLHMKCLG